MFFIFGGYVKSPKGKKKIKSHKDTDSYLCAFPTQEYVFSEMYHPIHIFRFINIKVITFPYFRKSLYSDGVSS